MQFIANLLQFTELDNGFDVECGDRFGMQSIIPNIPGCDKSSKMLEANPANDALLQQCDAYGLPYGERLYDLVYCWELFHHIAFPQKVVDEMTRVTDKAVLLCEPNCVNPAMTLFGIPPALRKRIAAIYTVVPGETHAQRGSHNGSLLQDWQVYSQ